MILARTLTLLILLVPSYVLGQRPVGAIVEEFQGSVLLEQNGKQVRLKPKLDIARSLFVGERVYCEKGAKLTIKAGSKTLELDENSGWYTIVPPDSAQFKKIIDAYGRTGGRDRGDFTVPILYAPANDSSVVPEQFEVRWLPLKQLCVVSFVIQDANGQEIWRQREVDGSAGLFGSARATEALSNYREKKGSGVLQLKLADSCGNEDRVNFTVLSVDAESTLNQALATWAGEQDQLMTHLGRASVFVEYEMFAQAADEYEAALKRVPESSALLKLTIAAQRRTGNRARAKELELRLSKNKE
jgi:hypothetical protein